MQQHEWNSDSLHLVKESRLNRLHTARFHLHDIPRKRQNYTGCMVWLGEREMIIKRHEGIFWHYENVLYLDAGGGYMTVHFDLIVYSLTEYRILCTVYLKRVKFSLSKFHLNKPDESLITSFLLITDFINLFLAFHTFL